MTSLSDYNKSFIIRRYAGIEGGYVNDPKDLGGETNHGITKALALSYKAELVAKFNWDGTMRNLSADMAYWLFDIEFWTKMRLDDVFAVHPLLADKLFDIGINAGKTRSITFLQEFLNVNNNEGKLYADLKVDGGAGNITLTALRGFVSSRGVDGVRRLLFSLVCRQTSYYMDISASRVANERFTYGWITRSYESMAEYTRLGYLFG